MLSIDGGPWVTRGTVVVVLFLLVDVFQPNFQALSPIQPRPPAPTLLQTAPSTLQECYVFNQWARSTVTSWVSRSDWNSPPSLYNYGLPDFIYPLINSDVGPLPIGHDLLSFLGSQLLSVSGAREPRRQPPRRLNYFEVGVSVGKCLFTQLEFFWPISSRCRI